MDSCKCYWCERYRVVKQLREKMNATPSSINHRLFSNNKSTSTHWFPSRNRPPILIRDLNINHLAAIVDQYEGEAVKFIHEQISPRPLNWSEFRIRRSSGVQEFLRKHVRAWQEIKNNERKFKLENPVKWRTLFYERKYSKKENKYHFTTDTGRMSSGVGALGKSGPAKSFFFDIESFKGLVDKEFTTGRYREQKKALLLLRVTRAKVAISTVLAELEDYIKKEF